MLVNERGSNSSILVMSGQTSSGNVSFDDRILEEYVTESISPLISIILSSDAKKNAFLNKRLSNIGILVDTDSVACGSSVKQAKVKLTSICETLKKVVDVCTQACLEQVPLDMFPPYVRDDARRLLDQCVENKWLDDHYQLVEGTPKLFAAVLAHHIGATLLGQTQTWKIFGSLWHEKNMRQVYFQSVKYGYGNTISTEIKSKIKL